MKMQAHVSDIGWQDKENNGKIIGTTGKNKGIEHIVYQFRKKIMLTFIQAVSMENGRQMFQMGKCLEQQGRRNI